VPVVPLDAHTAPESALAAETALPPEPAPPAAAQIDVPAAEQPSAPAPAAQPGPVTAEPAAPVAAPVAPPPESPSRRAPSLPRWGVTAILVALAALVSGTVAYLVARGDGETAAATPAATSTSTSTGQETVPEAPLSLAALVPRELWKNCAVQNQPTPGAAESAVCLQPGVVAGQNPPDRWQISIYPDSASLQTAYDAARAAAPKVPNGGRCDGTYWGGSGPWAHEGTPPKPGGHRFCYFDGDDAVIVWTHERLGQATHRDILAVAREGDTDHAALYNWWRFWHHRIGKVAS
jgi:hypothetical protein